MSTRAVSKSRERTFSTTPGVCSLVTMRIKRNYSADISLGLIDDRFMEKNDPEKHLQEDVSIHIFTVSSAMVAVRLTVIGLIRVVITLGR
jgi:hypothetical protein